MNRIDLTKPKKPEELRRLIPQVQDTTMPIFLFEFAGPIGAGKSETAKEMVKLLDEMHLDDFVVVSLEEDINSEDTKKAIDDFYSGKSSSPSTLEKIICGKRLSNLIQVFSLHKARNDARPTIIISDRAIEEDCQFIYHLLENTKDADEVDGLNAIIDNIKSFAEELNDANSAVFQSIFYLDPGFKVALQRIKKRGRPSEAQLSEVDIEELTTDPCDFVYSNNLTYLDNSNLTARETATMLTAKLCWTCASPDNSMPSPPLMKLLVSFYGVPGSGKTSFVKALTQRLSDLAWPNCDPSFAEPFLDDSDGMEIEEQQRRVYEVSSLAMSPEDMQKYIDERRLEDFHEISSDETYFSAIAFTDIGPLTSNIFRMHFGQLLDSRYLTETEKPYDFFLNVVVMPDSIRHCRDAIRRRNRPGEYEWFNSVRLGDIQSNINVLVLTDKRKNVLNVVINNNYDEESIDEMCKTVMEKVRDALIRHSEITER